MYFVYKFGVGEDLTPLTKALWRQNIGHQILSKSDGDELWIANPRHQPMVERLILMFQGEPSSLSQVNDAMPTDKTRSSNLIRTLLAQARMTPSTILVLLASLIVAFITNLGADLSTVRYFTISDYTITGSYLSFSPLSDTLSRGEYWRLFTPALIHFSVIHIVFNALWVWEIGRKLERLLGSVLLAVSVLLIAVSSNVFQFLVDGTPMFGGLSGVVYGFIGFAWLTPFIRKDWPVLISRQLMLFFMIWLVIGYTSVLEFVGVGRIANTAHIIGLFSGFALSATYSLFTQHRYRRK